MTDLLESRAWPIVLGGAILVTVVSAAVWRPAMASTEAPPGVPKSGTTAGYIGAAACRPCHAGEHASFERTWHRTMTQLATPATVLAPFERRGDEVWHDGKRIVLTTGAHREQAYWTNDGHGGLEILPVVWIPGTAPEKGVLIPRNEAFLLPPDAPLPAAHWGGSCIACHAVAGEPHRDARSDRWDTRVAELGVSCEACHGPGAEHAARFRDPVARWSARGANADFAATRIVHPRKLEPARQNQLCGQCHAYAYPKDEVGWWKDGYARTFRAGDTLERSRTLLDPSRMAGEDGAPEIDAPASAIFWPDGDVRVGGREYNGLVDSKCKATCLDCHAMHSGDPAGQLRPNRTCTTDCHVSPRMQTHAKHSAAVGCVDCHMPKTSYALMSAVRSHRIAIPREADDDGKPSACHLCHLDKDDWAAKVGLRGDAGVRALLADALGHSANAAYAAPLLDGLEKDPYAAVRFIARRSRRNFAGIERAAVVLPPGDDRPIVIAE